MQADISPPVGPLVHRVKRAMLAPRRARRRRVHAGDEPALVALLEHFDYSDAVYRFHERAGAEPHLLHDFTADGAEVVLDIGGYVGEWCVPVAERVDLPIHVFEPSVWARDRLMAATAPHASITVHRFGLAGADTTASLARIGPGSTTLGADPRWERAEVELREVVGVLDELAVTRAIVKVNIEGGEYDLLERLLDTGDIARVATLLIQFHEWLPRAHWRRWRIRRRLRATHRLVWDYPWVWERWEPRTTPPAGEGATS